MNKLESICALLVIAWSSNVSAFYNAQQGRWLSRDLIGESGGLSIYAFALNNAASRVDIDGRVLLPYPYTPPPDPPHPPTSLIGRYVCCRVVRGGANDSWTTRTCGGWFTHCDIKSASCDAGETQHPINMATAGTMDNGTSCSSATSSDVSSCLTRNPYSAGGSVPGSNCQSNTRDRLGSCCLEAPTWSPSWYAYPLPDPPPGI